MQVRIKEPALTKLKNWMTDLDRDGSYILNKMINAAPDDHSEIPSISGQVSNGIKVLKKRIKK